MSRGKSSLGVSPIECPRLGNVGLVGLVDSEGAMLTLG